jgi:hypothetical protein
MEIDTANPVHDELVFHLRSLKKFLFVVTDEPSIVIKDLEQVLHKYSSRTNVLFRGNWLKTKEWFNAVAYRSEMMPVAPASAFLRALQSNPLDDQDFFIIPDADKVLFEDGVDVQLRAIKEQLTLDSRTIKLFIALAPQFKVPPEFESVFVKILGRGLTEEEIRHRMQPLVGEGYWKIDDEAYKAGVGLTGYHVDTAYAEAAIRSKKARVLSQEQKVVQDSGRADRIVHAEDIELYRSRQKV